MDPITTNCALCTEEFTYEPVMPKAVVGGRKNRRELTNRTICDGCRKNNRRKNRTEEKGYLSKDESKRDKEIREARENLRFYIFDSLYIAPPMAWHAGPGEENPLEFY